MSSELFESREDDLRQICDSVRRRLSDQVPKYTGEMRKRQCRELERSLEEATILLQEMESELRKAPPSYRNAMLNKLRTYRQDLENLSREVNRNLLSRPSDQQQPSIGTFYDNDNDDPQSFESVQRARLMQGTESLYRASDSLARSHQVAAETDQIGNEIIGELGTQRESLLRTRDRLDETDANLSKSRKIVNTMMKRVMTNKLLLAVIILLELAILGVVIWWKFFKK